MKSWTFLSLALAGALSLSACPKPQAPAVQTFKGQLALSGFPATVNEVRIVKGDKVVAHAPVATDGRFSISQQAGQGYQLQFADANGQSVLVFPRASGNLDSSFAIAGATKPFDFGKVIYVGDPSQNTFHFKSGGAAPATDTDQDNVECEDGIDPATGAVCVDDVDDEGAACGDANNDTAEASDEASTDPASDTDNIECEDGVDPSGAACANQDDASEADTEAAGSEEDSASAGKSGIPSAAAVPEHNIPATVGCATEQDTDNVEQEQQGEHGAQDGADEANGESD